MSDAADGTSMRACVGVSPGKIATVTELLGDLYAAKAPGGAAVLAARSAGIHETFSDLEAGDGISANIEDEAVPFSGPHTDSGVGLLRLRRASNADRGNEG
jgi:hypothetical protein